MQKFLVLPLVALLLAVMPLVAGRSLLEAKELRRSMNFIRPMLMGDAYTALGDEASVLFYNPAGLARVPAYSTEILNPQVTVDKRIKTAIRDPDAVTAEYEGLSESDFRSKLGDTVFANVSLRLPAITMPATGIAYGLGAEALTYLEIMGNPVLPGMHLEFHVDSIIFFGMAWRVTDNLDLGITPKLIERYGVDKKYTFGELFAAGATLNIDNDPAYQDAINGVTFSEFGADMGLLYHFSFWDLWKPRMGISMLNIGGSHPHEVFRGMEFGPRANAYETPQAGELPQINTIGVAVSPTFGGVRYSIALDIVDATKTVLPGRGINKRTRLGFEMGMGIRNDGTALLSILGGFNATHTSMGVLTRASIFEVGFGYYTVETGEDIGDNPDTRFVLIFGFRI